MSEVNTDEVQLLVRDLRHMLTAGPRKPDHQRLTGMVVLPKLLINQNKKSGFQPWAGCWHTLRAVVRKLEQEDARRHGSEPLLSKACNLLFGLDGAFLGPRERRSRCRRYWWDDEKSHNSEDPDGTFNRRYLDKEILQPLAEKILEAEDEFVRRSSPNPHVPALVCDDVIPTAWTEAFATLFSLRGHLEEARHAFVQHLFHEQCSSDLGEIIFHLYCADTLRRSLDQSETEPYAFLHLGARLTLEEQFELLPVTILSSLDRQLLDSLFADKQIHASRLTVLLSASEEGLMLLKRYSEHLVCTCVSESQACLSEFLTHSVERVSLQLNSNWVTAARLAAVGFGARGKNWGVPSSNSKGIQLL